MDMGAVLCTDVQGSTQRLSWDGKSAGGEKAGGERVAASNSGTTAINGGGGASPEGEEGGGMAGEEMVSTAITGCLEYSGNHDIFTDQNDDKIGWPLGQDAVW